MMKLKSITIMNMHNVELKTYKFNNLTYLIGLNGAGKSTVLEAIQLAILGYIPGYAKTNDSIMKHCNSTTLNVKAVLDNDGEEVTIDRTFNQIGGSVKSLVTVKPDKFDIKEILSDIELPIFNFSEFKDMTANKLKQWFIDFLPNSTDNIDWDKCLRETVQIKNPIFSDELIHEVIGPMQYQPELSGLEQVKFVNSTCKDLQSFYKGQLKNLEGTIQSLVYYDDCEFVDEAECTSKRSQLEQEKTRCIQIQSAKSQVDSLNCTINSITEQLNHCGYTDLTELEQHIQRVKNTIQGYESEIQHNKEVINNWTVVRNTKSLVTSTKCPFLDKECDELVTMVEQNLQEVLEADEILTDARSKVAKFNSLLSEALAKQKELTQEYDKIKDLNKALMIAKEQLLKLPQQNDVNNVRTLEEIDTDLVQLADMEGKIAANKRYEALQQKITSDKFEIENKLEILKIWIKLTDANGMQSTLMTNPFIELADKITNYLNVVFSDTVEAKFYITDKANSFSFGIVRNNNYIQYDYLSSGERCLYALAMMMCILDNSKSKLKLIMIDDMLDHLDDSNATKLFESLVSNTDIQFILAGVKSCSNKDICVEIK